MGRTKRAVYGRGTWDVVGYCAKRGKRNMVKDADVCVVGHSQVSHYKQYLDSTEQHTTYKLEGTPSMTMDMFLRRKAPQTKQCIVLLGVVELLSMATPHPQFKGRTVAYLIRQALRVIHRGPTVITWVAVPPTPCLTHAQDAIRIQFNSFLELNCRVLDIPLEAQHYARDGLHLNSEGNATMCTALATAQVLFPQSAPQCRRKHFVGFFKGSPFCNLYHTDIHTSKHTFSSAEQMYQHEKAMSVGDMDVARKIRATHSPDDCKHLGGQVQMYPEDVSRWNAHRVGVMRDIIHLKFQSPDLRHLLKTTGKSLLAEMSPYDTFWGTGMDSNSIHAASLTSSSEGNMLGRILMEERDFIHRPWMY